MTLPRTGARRIGARMATRSLALRYRASRREQSPPSRSYEARQPYLSRRHIDQPQLHALGAVPAVERRACRRRARPARGLREQRLAERLAGGAERDGVDASRRRPRAAARAHAPARPPRRRRAYAPGSAITGSGLPAPNGPARAMVATSVDVGAGGGDRAVDQQRIVAPRRLDGRAERVLEKGAERARARPCAA